MYVHTSFSSIFCDEALFFPENYNREYNICGVVPFYGGHCCATFLKYILYTSAHTHEKVVIKGRDILSAGKSQLLKEFPFQRFFLHIFYFEKVLEAVRRVKTISFMNAFVCEFFVQVFCVFNGFFIGFFVSLCEYGDKDVLDVYHNVLCCVTANFFLYFCVKLQSIFD